MHTNLNTCPVNTTLLETCPACLYNEPSSRIPFIFQRIIEAPKTHQVIEISKIIFSYTLQIAISCSQYFKIAIHLTLQCLGTALYPLKVLTICPIVWSWGVFLQTFDTIIKPLVYFAVCAVLIGSLGGLVIGGSFLLIQQILPNRVKSRNHVRGWVTT